MLGPVSRIEGRVNSVGFLPDERLILYLELAAAFIRTFDLQYDLISTLVERWCPETHTFHLPCEECIITLEDVALQLRHPIDENAVTGVSSISRPATLCYELLCRSPSEGKFASFELGVCSVSHVVLRTLSDDRSFCNEHRWMPHTAAIVGTLPDAILVIY
ncbi:hypothetical protein J1N35_043452 [Gossypium stocksii]|uniref:Aminotransferase-like plant mobile domain-containing protein n=1 Tax=Gossypium stocksii TaxID=47602 RepID=A0A9D3U7G9_9ROSI|nr:hypothetical protein J1N35_043452 [Gossypium stocksii]